MDSPTGPDPDEPAMPGLVSPAASGGAYRVLARKYRPRSFDDLIGQEAMVRTLSNAFEAGRIPQAWMLTGVRGVGKTTTARILARALNYDSPEGGVRPTVRLPSLGVHCQAIMEGRHIDVIEIDAASNNGVDNVRQITDAVRYAPTSARYKVYIVDEVHMLSQGAFNAFLKTLEEPPPHAKFVFATTEIRKVPVTVLSRCQRFDLRRVESDKLVAHLARISAAEGVEAEPDALASLARAAEGSVRDALSLLDQAIAHGAGRVTAESVRDMLGLADRAQVIDLFEAVMRGDVPTMLAGLKAGYDAGSDPAVLLTDLAAFTHQVTRMKLVPESARDPALTEAERVRGASMAGRLSVRALSRAWQILLRGIPEVEAARRPLAAAEMVLVRLAYAADLPTPDEALQALAREPGDGARSPSLPPPAAGGGAASARAAAPAEPVRQAPAPARPVQPMAQAAPMQPPRAANAPEAAGPRLRRFEDVVAMAGERREIGLKSALERDVRLVRFEEGQIEFALGPGGSPALASDLSRALQAWTGRRWVVAVSSDPGGATLMEQRRAREEERRDDAAQHPLVRAVLTRFPGAEIVNVREAEDEAVPNQVAEGPEPDEER